MSETRVDGSELERRVRLLRLLGRDIELAEAFVDGVDVMCGGGFRRAEKYARLLNGARIGVSDVARELEGMVEEA